MSSSIDQRIVSMKFDNAQFEQGAKTSMGTLEKLKNSLNFSGSSKALDNVANSVNSIDASGAIGGIEELGIRFSAMGVIAKRVLENITDTMMNKLGGAIQNTIGLVKSGGMRRALNLEQANFSMMGILGDEKKVAEVMGPNGPVQKAVEGTAYGLDAAALAASNLIATGMDISELGDPLKAISGIAAQTGKSYELMSDIILDAYAKNYVSGMEISRLQEQGINATAELIKYYKSLGQEYTADELSDMIRKKQIGAEDLTKSLMHFYENAARANDTYTGSLSNLQAALSRLGAKFYTPYLKNMRNIFNALRPMVNSISAMLDPIINKINSVLTKLSEVVVSKITKMTTKIDEFKETIAKINFDSFKDFIISVEKLVDSDTSKKLRDFFKNFFADEIQYDEFGNAIEDTRTKLEKINDEFELTPYNKIISGLDSIKRGFKDFGSGLSNIPRLLLSAFEGTSDYLPNFVDGFYNVGKTIREAGANFKIFFENFDVTLLKNTIGVVANIFGILASSASTLGSTISRLLAPQFKYLTVMFKGVAAPLVALVNNIANTIREFDLINLAIKKVSDVISGTLKPVSEWIYNRFFSYNGKPGLVYTLWDAVNYLSNGFENLAPKIADFLTTEHDFSSIGETIASIFSKIAEILSPVGKKLTEIKDSMTGFSGDGEGLSVLEKLSNVLDKVGSVISAVASKISKGLGLIGDAIRNTFTIPNIKSMVAALTVFSSGGMLYKFNQFLAAFPWSRVNNFKFKGPINDILISIDLIGKQLVGTMRTLKESFQIKSVKDIATSILIFAAALLVLSMIDPERLIAASIAAGAALTELMYSFERLARREKPATGMIAISNSLIAISVALLVLSFAMAKLGTMDWDELGRGLVAIGTLMVMMTAYIHLVADISKNQGKIVKSASTLIALAIAIDLLVIAVKKLGEMDYNQLVQGLIGVGLLISGLAIFQGMSSLGTFKASSGVGLLALAGALILMSTAVEKMGRLDPKVMASGLLAIGLALGEIALFSNVLSGTKVFIAAKAITAVSTAMWFISKALVMMAEVDPQRLAESLIMMMIALMGVVAALSLMPEKSAMSNAGAITLVAAGMVILAGALKILATIPMEKMVTAIFGIGAALAIFGIAARALKGVELTLLAIGAAMALWGIGIAALAVGITILTPALVVFASAWITSLEIMLDGIINMGSKITAVLATIFSAIIGALTLNRGELLVFIADTLLALLDKLIEYIPQFTERVGALLDAVLEFIYQNIPKIIEVGFAVLLAFLQGIADNIQQVVETASDIVVNFLNGLAAKNGEIIEAGFNLLLSFIEGIANAVREHGEDMANAAWDLASALVEGLIDGLGALAGNIWDSITGVGETLVDGFCSFMGIASPSKKMQELGEYCIEGLNQGLQDDSSVVDSAEKTGSSVIGGLNNGLSMVDTIKVTTNMMSGLANGVQNSTGMLNNVVQGVSKKVLDTMSQTLSANNGMNISKVYMTGINTGFIATSQTILMTVRNISTSILNAMRNAMNPAVTRNIGVNAMLGLSNGMESMRGSIMNKAYSIADASAQAMRSALKERSPSRVFREIGAYAVEGFAIGLSEVKPAIDKVKDFGETVIDTFAGSLDSIDDIDPTIRPVLDLTDVQNGVSRIDSMFGGSSLAGSISANVNNSGFDLVSAIQQLTNKLNQNAEEALSPEEIYEAVKAGASNATFIIRVSGRELTSIVNELNAETATARMNFIGG